MPTTYKGVTVPLPTDLSDGPKLAKDMVDTLPSSDFYKALDGGTAGPFRIFPTAAERDAWTTRPDGALASITADGSIWLWRNSTGAWTKLVVDTPQSLPQGAVLYHNGTNVIADANMPVSQTSTVLNKTVPVNLNINRTVTIAFSFRLYLINAAQGAVVSVSSRATVAGSTFQQVVGTASVTADGTYFSGSSSVKVNKGGASSVQLYVYNNGPGAAGCRDVVCTVTEN